MKFLNLQQVGFLVLFFSSILVLYLITPNPESFFAIGDTASNELRSSEFLSNFRSYGNHSRVGLFHPGPFMYFIGFSGELLFYKLAPIFDTKVAAQHFAFSLFALIAAFTGFNAAIQHRFLALGCTLTVLTMFHTHIGLLNSNWPPFFYVAGFIGLLGFSIAYAKRGTGLAGMMIIGAMLVHGHISHILLIPVFIAAVVSLKAVITAMGLGLPVAKRELWTSIQTLFVPRMLLFVMMVVPTLFYFYKYFDEIYAIVASRSSRGFDPSFGIGYILTSTFSSPLQQVAWCTSLLCLIVGLALSKSRLALLSVPFLFALLVFYYSSTFVDSATSKYIGFWFFTGVIIGPLILVSSLAPRLKLLTSNAIAIALCIFALAAVWPVRDFPHARELRIADNPTFSPDAANQYLDANQSLVLLSAWSSPVHWPSNRWAVTGILNLASTESSLEKMCMSKSTRMFNMYVNSCESSSLPDGRTASGQAEKYEILFLGNQIPDDWENAFKKVFEVDTFKAWELQIEEIPNLSIDFQNTLYGPYRPFWRSIFVSGWSRGATKDFRQSAQAATLRIPAGADQLGRSIQVCINYSLNIPTNKTIELWVDGDLVETYDRRQNEVERCFLQDQKIDRKSMSLVSFVAQDDDSSPNSYFQHGVLNYGVTVTDIKINALLGNN